jgi:hypothetical protein
VYFENKWLQQSDFFKSFFLFFLDCLVYKLYKLIKVLYFYERLLRKISMNKEQFERLNALSEKAINDCLTQIELEEFNKLLTSWNQSTEYNLLRCIYPSDPND